MNLSSVEYLSSSALAKLVALQTLAAGAGGKLRLCGMRAHIQKIFSVTRLDKWFDIHDDEQAALDRF